MNKSFSNKINGMKRQKGFTLIELLIVIADAGLGMKPQDLARAQESLRSVAEASAETARDLGVDPRTVFRHLDLYRRDGGNVIVVTHGTDATPFATRHLRLASGRLTAPPTPSSPP